MNIIGFLSAAVLLTLMPGPDILFVITQSITRGKKAGIVFALGLCTGLLVHIAAISLGISVLIKESPTAFFALKILGAAYLIYLGVKAFIARHQASFELSDQKGESQKLYRKGILMNILNPKVILFFLAFLPQFVNTDSGNNVLQMCILGMIFILQAFVIFTLAALGASQIAGRLMENPKTALGVNVIVSIIYCCIGISILFA
ncbi:LysE family translocator [Odoribacter sp. OttesenSCG-928-J03]|nr:LysE family translocator [Odoribacter sp. OttesenSCG-928-J03]